MIKKLLIAAVGILFITATLYFFAIKYVRGLPEKPRRLANDTYLKIVAHINNLVDYLYPKTYWHWVKARQLPQYSLKISDQGLTNLNLDVSQAIDLNFISKENLHKEKIDLVINNQTYPAIINLHGTTKGNFKHFKKSYTVKLKDSQTINEVDEFNLLNPFQHNFISAFLNNTIARRLNLYYNEQYPVTVQLNRSQLGIYIYEETLGESFLKKRDLADAEIIKLKDTWAEIHRNQPNTFGLNAHHLSAFDLEIANVESLESANQKVLYSVNSLFKAIKEQDPKKILASFDLDYMARYDAYREFFGVDHDTAGDNLKFIYSFSDQKFYPIVRSEGDINPLLISQGTTLASYNAYDPQVANQFDYPRLFLILNRDPEFRQLKYQYLYKLIQDYPVIQADFKALYHQLADLFIYDPKDDLSIRAKKKIHQDLLATINNNVALIRQELDFAAVFINVINDQEDITIEIIPDSVVPISFEQLTLEFSETKEIDLIPLVNQQILLPQFNQLMHLVPTTYTYQLKSSSPGQIDSLKVKAVNRITGAIIKDVHWAIASP